MKDHKIQIKNKILLSTILVGVLSVSFLGGCNNPPPGNGSGNGSGSTSSNQPPQTSSVTPTPKTAGLKTELQNLKNVISGKTISNSFEPAEVKSQWDAFKTNYNKYTEYVSKLKPNQKEIAQSVLDLIQNKINKVDSIFSSQDGGINPGNQPNNSAEVLQEYLGEIEEDLGAIDKILQVLKSSDKSTPANNSIEPKGSSDSLLVLTFSFVLVTFLLVFVLVIFLIFLGLKDDQARRKNRSEEIQKNTNNPKLKLQEILENYQKL